MWRLLPYLICLLLTTGSAKGQSTGNASVNIVLTDIQSIKVSASLPADKPDLIAGTTGLSLLNPSAAQLTIVKCLLADLRTPARQNPTMRELAGYPASGERKPENNVSTAVSIKTLPNMPAVLVYEIYSK